jgi:quercetin dioxygenase-like cupin family protein
MLCVKVVATADGGSQFGDTDIEQTEAPYVQNVPPVLVSQPLPVEALVVVTVPDDVRSTELHPAPRRQFVIVLHGVFEIETSDGDRRTLPPGGFALLEDTTGRGHVTRVLSSPASFVAVPLADSALRM